MCNTLGVEVVKLKSHVNIVAAAVFLAEDNKIHCIGNFVLKC